MAPLRRVHKTTSVTQRTYRNLERAISQNRLSPGQVLVIADLAEELGVSRTPVREALLMLQKAGLVEVANGRLTVAGLSTVDLDEVFEFREAIEIFCIDKLAERSDKQRLGALRDMLTEHVERDDCIDPEAAAAADLRFHRAVVALADNARLLGAWDQMATHLQRFWQDGKANLGRVKNDVAECLAIVDALEAGDTATAARVLHEHLRQAKASLSAWNEVERTRA
jgi:DNA-binding GntR family transcriptional regulator